MSSLLSKLEHNSINNNTFVITECFKESKLFRQLLEFSSIVRAPYIEQPHHWIDDPVSVRKTDACLHGNTLAAQLWNSKVDCPALLQNINFRTSGGTTQPQDLFRQQFYATSYLTNQEMAWVQYLGNAVCGELDLIHDSQGCIKRVATRYFLKKMLVIEFIIFIVIVIT